MLKVHFDKTHQSELEEPTELSELSIPKKVRKLPDNALTVDGVQFDNFEYACFTNEKGQSNAGYLIKDQKTRNGNLYSSEKKEGEGFDPAETVLANIQACYKELGAEPNAQSHKFFMTTYYSNNGKSDPLIITCDTMDKLNQLKTQARENIDFEDTDTSNPRRLGLEPNMRKALHASDISVLKADALIFKAIPGQVISALGASGDAHPIMMFDDESKIACYISGAHANLSKGVLEKSFDKMVELGANPKGIRLVIGPGLGNRSYEFGPNAPQYFAVPQALTPVVNVKGEPKFLVDIKKLVTGKLANRLEPGQIFDMELNTMGFDLYDESPDKPLTQKNSVNFSEFTKAGLLFYSARLYAMQKANNVLEHNPEVYNEVGRQLAGFVVR